jgi:membrane protease YdiL (CAAX protease family)
MSQSGPFDERRSPLARINQPEPEPPWGFLSVTNAVAIWFIAQTVVASLVSFALFSGTLTPTVLLAGWAAGAGISAAIVYGTRSRPEQRAALRIDRARGRLPLYVLLGIGTMITAHLFVAAMSRAFIPTAPLIGIGQGGLLEAIIAVLFTVGFAPLADELVFRGIALPYLRHAIGPWGGLVVHSALYSLMYALVFGLRFGSEAGQTYTIADPAAAQIWYGAVLPLLLAFVFGAVRITSGSTSAAIATHGGAGVFAVLAALVLGS